MNTPAFKRYIGIDFSGAQTPEDNLRAKNAPPISMMPL